MGTRNRSGSAFLSYALKYFMIISLHCCTATDTLNQSHQLSVGQTLISAGQIFELGFFSPGNSSKQYVGIWYKNISVSKVWVANRENPLTVMGPASCLTIGSDGNLKLVDGKQNTVWSTNVSVQSNNSIAVLSDNGNFILKDSISGLVSWESFSYPCNTFLSGMKIGLNTKIGENLLFSSWQARDDPSPGNFTAGLVAQKPPQAFVWNGSKPYWRAGPWDGWQFIGVQDTDEGYSNGLNLIPDNQEGSVYLTFNTFNSSFVTFIILTPAGSLKMLNWDEEIKRWYISWEAPENPCDVYGACGPFGVCNTNGSPICECLKGFVPKSNEEWSKGNWTSGCVRRTELLCEKNTSGLASRRNKNDGFWKLSGMKLPDLFDFLYGEDGPGCQQWCLDNCSCKAYSYVAGIGCMVWDADLMDTQQFSLKGEDLFLRLAYSELGEEKGKIKIIISFTAISGSILLGAFLYGFHRWKVNQRGKRRDMVKGFDLADSIDTSRDTSRENVWGHHALQWDSSELPIFDFDKILVATNNFSKTNRLGGGGFGPVYKGKLEDGQEIAVKRLSSHSGQGVEEFKNEIILIAKLQHRNLVRLLGCCIEGEEKLLIYEDMKNKSLDTFLFDSTKRVQLDWVKRFNIIQGVARGLLYLHRDSCLRVIHRDLKAGNILLDDDMNPKISDFGLARAFRVTQEIANTHRVVGTLGYMSPEYAMGGIISEKSDVFSFGILLLEIISSMKNTSFNYHDKYLNLIDYACKLWNECRGLDLMDQALADSCSPSEVMRCIHVGLLCVQDHVGDRPTMSAVVLMLSSETDLPQPKQPTFTFQSSLDSNLQLQCNNIGSTNEVTASVIEGR